MYNKSGVWYTLDENVTDGIEVINTDSNNITMNFSTAPSGSENFTINIIRT